MQACMYLAVGPTSFDGGGGGGGSKPVAPLSWLSLRVENPSFLRRRGRVSPSAAVGGQRNHYAVLGVPPSATPSQIKKAYRLLALKFHPDVNKEAGAIEAFKCIRHAYDILSNERTRTEYDQSLHHPHTTSRPLGDDWAVNGEYEEERLRFYRWAAYIKRKAHYERYWDPNHTTKERFSSYYDKANATEADDEEKESFIDVLKSAFLSIFLMHTVGVRLSLTFSSLMALVDPKLDSGYKFGYLLAWALGGRAGILLTMFLSFASWVCGKTSSSIVALVVIAVWFGSNLARYAPLPQGALLTLLYMSIKLQVDLV